MKSPPPTRKNVLWRMFCLDGWAPVRGLQEARELVDKCDFWGIYILVGLDYGPVEKAVLVVSAFSDAELRPAVRVWLDRTRWWFRLLARHHAKRLRATIRQILQGA